MAPLTRDDPAVLRHRIKELADENRDLRKDVVEQDRVAAHMDSKFRELMAAQEELAESGMRLSRNGVRLQEVIALGEQRAAICMRILGWWQRVTGRVNKAFDDDDR